GPAAGLRLRGRNWSPARSDVAASPARSNQFPTAASIEGFSKRRGGGSRRPLEYRFRPLGMRRVGNGEIRERARAGDVARAGAVGRDEAFGDQPELGVDDVVGGLAAV